MNWLNSLFSSPDGTTPWWGIILAIIIVLAIGAAITAAVLFIINRLRKRIEKHESTRIQWTIRELIFGALCIALAFALSYLKFFEMLYGGSITPASMLPIMIYAYLYGTPKGLIIGLGYGLLQMLQGIFITPLENPVLQIIQIIMDYGLAFMALALTGLFKKNFLLGIIAGGIGRLLLSTLSGVLFFSMYAEGQSVFAYSFIYNVTYIGPDTLICFVIALVPGIRKTIELFKREAQRPAQQAA